MIDSPWAKEQPPILRLCDRLAEQLRRDILRLDDRKFVRDAQLFRALSEVTARKSDDAALLRAIRVR